MKLLDLSKDQRRTLREMGDFPRAPKKGDAGAGNFTVEPRADRGFMADQRRGLSS